MDFLSASWPSLSSIHALSTTRKGGMSIAPYDENNLGLHVGDNPQHVQQNRTRLIETLKLPSSPEWLQQIHSTECVVIEEDANRIADASVTRRANTVLAIMTADCLPILLTNKQGNEVAAIHAGWRGLANGVIDSTLKKMHSKPHELIAWIGPAICERCFETGDEVRATFIENYSFSHTAFTFHKNKLHANLPQLAELILQDRGIASVYQSGQCTFEAKNEMNTKNATAQTGAQEEYLYVPLPEQLSKNHYFSYRREKQTGRMVTLIWFDK